MLNISIESEIVYHYYNYAFFLLHLNMSNILVYNNCQIYNIYFKRRYVYYWTRPSSIYKNINNLFTVDLPHPYNKIGDGPEGPEVRTVSDELRPVLVGRTIITITRGTLARTKRFQNIDFPANIIGVRSHGKKLIIDIEVSGRPTVGKEGYMIIISLGMTGSMRYQPGNHSHIEFAIGEYITHNSLENLPTSPSIKESQIVSHSTSNLSIAPMQLRILQPKFKLYFDDSRRMGWMDLISNTEINDYFKNIGPDLLHLSLDKNTWIPLDKWLQIFCKPRRMKKNIFTTLHDQSYVASIGNYLAAEILYYSGVSPHRKLETITTNEWDTIRINAHKIVYLSYSYKGLTIESFISPSGNPGRYPRVVYGQPHDPLGNPVITETMSNGRTAHWVPAIQH